MLISNQEKQDPALATALNRPSQQSEQHEPLFTFKEALDYLRVSRSTLNRFLSAGKVIGHKVWGTWRFYASELQAAVQDVPPGCSTPFSLKGKETLR